MPTTILATKLYIPPLRSKIGLRPRLIGRLNEGLAAGHKLTLISASAGFGKTTLVSEWVANCGRSAAWLLLVEGDNGPLRFISYLVAALLGGLIIGFFVSYCLLRFFDQLATGHPTLISMFLSIIALVVVTLLTEVPAKFLNPTRKGCPAYLPRWCSV